MRHQITEARAEQIIDWRVMRALSTDGAYLHAEDAESQAEREQEITDRIEREVYAEYTVFDQTYIGRDLLD
jgi:hypothetical protein